MASMVALVSMSMIHGELMLASKRERRGGGGGG